MQQIKALARLTLTDPRAAGAALLTAVPVRDVLLQMAVVVVVVGVILTWIATALFPAPQNPMISDLMANPVLFAIIQLMMLMLSVFAIFLIGRLFGGIGSFEQTLYLSVWVQFYMLLIQAALIPVTLVVGALPLTLNLGLYFYFVWLMVNFIAVLHGFKSLWKVFAGLIAASFALSFVVLFLLGVIGIGVEGA